MTNWWDEYYTLQAKKDGYLARSAYKLKELDDKYALLESASTILDIWCAPGSWLQYISKNGEVHSDNWKIIWLDLKKVNIVLPGVTTYVQDISDKEWVQDILDEEKIQQFDLIVSDMAPDTIGMSDIDGIRSIGLIEKTLWIYDSYLKEWGKFAIKVFMWPWFEELVRDLRAQYGHKHIVTFKPKACRKQSHEIYIAKRG